MPKELLCVGKEQLAWNEYDEPPLGLGQLRVASQFTAAKHGTEMAVFKGYSGVRGRYDRDLQVFAYDKRYDPAGFRPGNMTVGAVTEVGPQVNGYAIGDRLLLYGGFRQTHIVAHDRCWKIPIDMPWQSAVCLDPADFALGAVRDGHVRVGDNVAIFGMGAIGLMVVQIARLAGAGKVIAVEPLASRRSLARQLGADLVLDPLHCDAGLEIKRATENRGADVAIDYSGDRQAIQAALRGVAYGATVVAGAYPPPYDAGLDFGAEAHVNTPHIVFSRACSEPNRDHPRWDERRLLVACMDLLTGGRVRGQEVVTPVVPFDELLETYPKIAAEPERLIKLGAAY